MNLSRRTTVASVVLAGFFLSLAIVNRAAAGDVTHRFIAFGQETYIGGADGEITWNYPHGTRDGYVLSNGNIVLTLSKSKKYAGGAVIEITPDGNETVIWQGTQAEVNSAHPTDSGTFEITRDKEVVWTHSDGKKVGIHHFQILDTNGEILDGPPLK